MCSILASDGEVAMVQLIDNKVRRTFAFWLTITFPSLGIGSLHVNNGATLAVDTHSFGKDTRALAEPDIKGIETSQLVAFNLGGP